MVTVTVRYHALLREKIGLDRESYSLTAADATCAGLLHAFSAKYANFQTLLPSLHVAVNNEIAAHDQPLSSGDTVDLLPPFGGG